MLAKIFFMRPRNCRPSLASTNWRLNPAAAGPYNLSFLFFPRRQEFSFALRRDPGFQMRLSFLRPRLEPGKRVARGFIERTESKSLPQRAADVRSRNSVLGPGPDRHVGPGLHFLIGQKLLVYPGEARV